MAKKPSVRGLQSELTEALERERGLQARFDGALERERGLQARFDGALQRERTLKVQFEKLQSVHREQIEDLLHKQAELMSDIAELLTRHIT